MCGTFGVRKFSLGMLLSVMLLSQSAVVVADDVDMDVDMAEIEAALSLGAEISPGECDQQLKAELEEVLRRSAPEELVRFEALKQEERLSILEIYRDSGYLPAVVSAMEDMPVSID